MVCNALGRNRWWILVELGRGLRGEVTRLVCVERWTRGLWIMGHRGGPKSSNDCEIVRLRVLGEGTVYFFRWMLVSVAA